MKLPSPLASTMIALLVAASSSVAAQAPAAAPGTPAAMPQADAAFASLDTNKDGSISREEFRTGWMAMSRTLAARETLRRQFGSVDLNGDGAIDASEYGKLLLIREAGASAPPLAQFDANRDNKLAFGEYLELVKQLAPRHGAAADAAAGDDP